MLTDRKRITGEGERYTVTVDGQFAGTIRRVKFDKWSVEFEARDTLGNVTGDGLEGCTRWLVSRLAERRTERAR